MKNDIILSIKDSSKSYGKEDVFSNLSLDFESDKATVIYGPSGCGKTTLLKCLALLEPLNGGDIFLKGKKVFSGDTIIDEQLVRDKIGIVFQDFHLWDNKKVLDNLTEALIHVKKMSKEEAMKKARDTAQELHISDEILNKYPAELSRGQRQRIAIARTLVMDPEIILLDEAAASLDEFLKDELVKNLDLLRSKNKTLIIVTHDSTFGDNIGDVRINFEDLSRSPLKRIGQ